MKNSLEDVEFRRWDISLSLPFSPPFPHKFACFTKQVKLSGETRWRARGEKRLGRQSGGFSRDEREKYRSPGDRELRDDACGSPSSGPFKKSGQYFPGRRGAFKCMYSYARVSLWREVWSKLFKLTRTLFSPLGLGHFLAPLHPRITSRPSLSLSLYLSLSLSLLLSQRPSSSSSFPPYIALSSPLSRCRIGDRAGPRSRARWPGCLRNTLTPRFAGRRWLPSRSGRQRDRGGCVSIVTQVQVDADAVAMQKRACRCPSH